MTSFVDKFEAPTVQTLDGWNGWNSIPNTASDLEINAMQVTQPAANKLIAARQEITIPATGVQKVRAYPVCFTGGESATSDCIIGVGGLRTAQKNVSVMDDWGIGVGLTWATNPDGTKSRQLFILRDALIGGGYGAGAYIVTSRIDVTDRMRKLVTAPGGSPTDIGVTQDLALILDAVSDGVRVRAYLNQNDEDSPTLEWIEKQDFLRLLDVPIGGNQYGWWYLALGSVPTARTTGFAYYEAADKTIYVPGLARPDLLTLRQLLEMARRRYEGRNAAANWDEEIAKDYANFTQDEIIATLGQECWFTSPKETLSLSLDASTRTVMPEQVMDVLSIRDATDCYDVTWLFDGITTNGRVAVKIPGWSSASFVVRYRMRVERMTVDTDRCIIPREHQEAIVLGICKRFATDAGNAERAAQFQQDYASRVLLLKADQKRLTRGMHPRAHIPEQQIILGYNHPLLDY